MKNQRKYTGLALIISYLGILSCTAPAGIAPESKPLVEAVYASGYVQSKGEIQLKSQAEGILRTQYVQEGDVVKKGQKLFEIIGVTQDARLANAETAYSLARRNSASTSPLLQEMENAVELAKENYLADSVNFVRYANMWKEKATSKQSFDQAQTAYQASRISWVKSKNTLDAKKDQVEKELDAALRELKSAQEERGFYEVTSDRDGIFFQSEKEVGELVRKGEVLGVIGLDEGFMANLKIDEQDISRLQPGQKVIFKIDAYPGKTFAGKVEKIYSKIDSKDQMLRVDAVFEDALPGKYTGLALEANIVIQEKEATWVIPGNYLLPGDTLLVLQDGQESKVKVKPGIRTLTEVEILSGVDAKTKLVKQ